MTTLNEIQTAVDTNRIKIVSIEQTKKGKTAIVTITNGLQKEVPFTSALTLGDWNNIPVKRI